MIFEQIRTGGDRNFAYILGDKRTGKAAVIDPSNDPSAVAERAKELGLEIVYLLNTHGHYDHTDGNENILSATSAILVHPEDGEKIALGDVTLTIIHTPGHTTDSICVLAEQPGDISKVITGDTLFVGKVGGTGLGEDARQEYDSLHKKLMTLSDDTEVWPGHDYGTAPSSTVGNERQTNPFLTQKSFEDFVGLKQNWAAYKREHGIS